MGKFGYTNGTRHYVQTRTGDGLWTDLPFVNDEGEMKGLWCSHRYSKANERVEELMAETGLSREYYRIVKRTFHCDETIIEHDPNYGKAYNNPSYDYTDDPDYGDDEVDSDADDDDDDDDTDSGAEDDAQLENHLESQVGPVPDTGDEPTEVIQHHNPLAN